MRTAPTFAVIAKALLWPVLWFCASNLLVAVLAAQCTNPTQVPNQTISSGSPTFSDNNALKATGVIVNGSASVTFVAGNCIELGPGFRATAGTAPTTFHAWVETAPSAVSVSPSSGAGLSQPFTWTVSSPSGYGNLAHVYALFNTSVSGANACYIYYSRGANLLFLADNSGTVWTGGFYPGSSGFASNSYCTIYGSGTSVSTSGNQLAVTVNVAFQSSFSSTKNNYLNAYDSEGLYTGWQQMGTWTVSGAQQYSLITAVSPSGGGSTTPSCPSGCLYTSGSQVQISATPAAGYQFSGFTGVDSSGGSVGYVTMNANRSVTANFTAAPPNITGISPTSGAVGTPVTITGTGFGTSGTVSFAGTLAQQIDSWSPTTVVARVPAGAATGIISLSTGGYQTSYQQQQFQVTAVGVTVSPASATLGQGQTQQFTATVTGTSNQQVTWSVAPTGTWNISSTGLFTAPGTIAVLQPVTVTATSVAQQTATGSATVSLVPPTPTITYLSLPSGPPQVGFVINGSNFGSAQGSVTITGLTGGDRQLTVINWSANANSITVQVPGATPLGAGQIYVRTSANVASNQVPFTVSATFGCNF
jgi:hypothetical protein